ncbi:MAG: SRPBCC family protein [Verrucomicrobia bacterium]|nr:MAG: SRPBCC family protein [Verrucomicrobiota bacterium]
MLPTVSIALVIVVVAFVVLVASRPDDYSVVRTARIDAPPGEVFGLVNDFHAWESWSPWAKRDPHMKIVFDGPRAGVGADYRWSGDRKVGEGRMTLTESESPARLRIRLEFTKPFAGVNDVGFAFAPEAGMTRVTWTMAGKLNFATKAFGLFVSMDTMIGRDFEQGLAQLKSVAEAASAKTGI